MNQTKQTQNTIAVELNFVTNTSTRRYNTCTQHNKYLLCANILLIFNLAMTQTKNECVYDYSLTPSNHIANVIGITSYVLSAVSGYCYITTTSTAAVVVVVVAGCSRHSNKALFTLLLACCYVTGNFLLEDQSQKRIKCCLFVILATHLTTHNAWWLGKSDLLVQLTVS